MGPTRGRPREFDPDAALDRVLPVFWRDGFEGASVQELAEAAGVSKPSLYAAYGNKEALYLAALERYVTRKVGGHVLALEGAADARTAVRELLLALVSLFTDAEGPGGCLVVTGTCTSGSPAVPDAVRAGLCAAMRGVTDKLEARMRRAQAEGQLARAADPRRLAEFYNTVIAGLSVRARGGSGVELLHEAVDDAMRLWPEAPPPAGALSAVQARTSAAPS